MQNKETESMRTRMLKVVQHTNSIRLNDEQLKTMLCNITDKISSDAFTVLMDSFPKKITYFENVLRQYEQEGGYFVMPKNLNDEFNKTIKNIEESDSYAAPSSKRPRTLNDEVCYTEKFPSNSLIKDLTETLCTDLGELSSMLGSIKLWLQKAVPRIEDGNNFGVSIQEDVISEITRVEEVTGTLCEGASKYHFSRAKMIGKVIKYPNVEDFKDSIRALDKKQMLLLRQTMFDCRINYGALFDHIHKNFEKLVNPRTDNTSNMY